MPVFGSIFSSISKDRKLTKDELIIAIRFLVAAQYDTVQMCEQLAASIADSFLKDVLKDIADDELGHASKLSKVLYYLNPQEGNLNKGVNMVTEMMEKKES